MGGDFGWHTKSFYRLLAGACAKLQRFLTFQKAILSPVGGAGRKSRSELQWLRPRTALERRKFQVGSRAAPVCPLPWAAAEIQEPGSSLAYRSELDLLGIDVYVAGDRGQMSLSNLGQFCP